MPRILGLDKKNRIVVHVPSDGYKPDTIYLMRPLYEDEVKANTLYLDKDRERIRNMWITAIHKRLTYEGMTEWYANELKSKYFLADTTEGREELWEAFKKMPEWLQNKILKQSGAKEQGFMAYSCSERYYLFDQSTVTCSVEELGRDK